MEPFTFKIVFADIFYVCLTFLLVSCSQFQNEVPVAPIHARWRLVAPSRYNLIMMLLISRRLCMIILCYVSVCKDSLLYLFVSVLDNVHIICEMSIGLITNFESVSSSDTADSKISTFNHRIINLMSKFQCWRWIDNYNVDIMSDVNKLIFLHLTIKQYNFNVEST